jgi:hypothetical protein
MQSGFIDVLSSDCRSVIRKYLPFYSRWYLARVCRQLAREDACFIQPLTQSEAIDLRFLSWWSADTKYNAAGAIFDQGIWPFRRHFVMREFTLAPVKWPYYQDSLTMAIQPRPAIIQIRFDQTAWRVYGRDLGQNNQPSGDEWVHDKSPLEWMRDVAGWKPLPS